MGIGNCGLDFEFGIFGQSRDCDAYPCWVLIIVEVLGIYLIDLVEVIHTLIVEDILSGR